MAHWAKLDENNIVINITVGNNADFDEGYEWLISNLGGRWVKTSYNTHADTHKDGETPFRKNYAIIGGVYDEERDAFIAPKPYSSWILNEKYCIWEAPIAYPTDDKIYKWNESTLSWNEII
jgi:hypothetical protein